MLIQNSKRTAWELYYAEFITANTLCDSLYRYLPSQLHPSRLEELLSMNPAPLRASEFAWNAKTECYGFSTHRRIAAESSTRADATRRS